MANARISNSRKCLNHFQDIERPLKKPKVAVARSSVSSLAEIGVAKHQQNDYETAEQCFSQALCRVDISYLCAQVETSFSGYNDTTDFPRKHSRCNSQLESQRATEATAERTSQSSIEYDEGMRVYQGLLKIKESSPPEEIVASLLYNIGQTYLQRGIHKEAILWFQQSVDKFCALGVSHSVKVIMNLHCLGYCHYRTGKGEKAAILYGRAHALVSEPALAGSHHMAGSVNCAGVLLFNEQPCDTEKAMETFHYSLELYREREGADLIAIATVLNNIGRVHYLRSEFNEARAIYEECMQIRRALLGDDSVDVAATVYNLGQTCYQLGQLDESLSNYREFLKIVVPIVGPKSKDVALVYKGIAQIYHERSDLKSALYYFTQTVEAQRASIGSLSDTASTLNKMGNLCYELNDFHTAMQHYQEGLKVEKAVLSANHPHIIITLTNIGHINKQLGEYKKALTAYRQVHRMQVKTFGADSFDTAETMSSIGLMQYHVKDYATSFESYQEALRIRRQHFDSDDHPDIASTLNSIGLVLFKQDVFDLAKKCFTQSLRIRSKLLGKDHRDVAILWYNIATVHFEMGEDELAIQMYIETLRVERKALGEEHPDVVLTLQHLGQVHQQLGRFEKSLEFFQEALHIERRREGSCDKSVGRILNLLGNVYLQLGMTSKMMDCYVEASRIYESHQDWGETLIIAGYNFYGLSKTNPRCAPIA
jgi:tetratricopeptide (TPR) repeat protein